MIAAGLFTTSITCMIAASYPQHVESLPAIMHVVEAIRGPT
jgi:hypothetical protein